MKPFVNIIESSTRIIQDIHLLRRLQKAGIRNFEVGNLSTKNDIINTTKFINGEQFYDRSSNFSIHISNISQTKFIPINTDYIIISANAYTNYNNFFKKIKDIRNHLPYNIKIRGQVLNSWTFNNHHTEIINQFVDLGVDIIDIVDILNESTPKLTDKLFKNILSQKYPIKYGIKTNDKHSIFVSIENGVKYVYSGLCSVDNMLSTNDIVYELHKRGISTGIDLEELEDINIYHSEKHRANVFRNQS